MFEENMTMNSLARLYKIMVFTIGTNIAYLNSELTMTRIVLKLDEKCSFLMKFMEIEFY